MGEAWREKVTRKSVVSVIIASIIYGIIIWHVLYWHSSGVYTEMFNWTGTDKAYLAVLYNLGLMILTGVILGLLMEKITGLLRYRHQGIEPVDNRGEGNGES